MEQTFERIQCDPRHGDVVMLQAARADGRLFGVWDMALAEIDDPAGASAILGRALAKSNSDAGTDVVALLDRLVRRASEWAQ